MSTGSPAPAGETAPRTPFPQAHWKFERTDDGDVRLFVWLEGIHRMPAEIPMREAEAWMFVHQADRVLSWAAQSGEGLFSSGPTPEQAATQLEIKRYVVTSKDVESHTRLTQATPWANWAEMLPKVRSQEGIAWLVDVFAVDDTQFLQASMDHHATVTPAPAAEPADG